ncbi:S-layer homology domain-containing protein [Paenibacillus sp. IITD108]|uniref:S-layer homology domain-containing protein n=1 Tax=Paenibacillus sp. IITD108 TaxID=3116649 RepID=UPI002F411C36
MRETSNSIFKQNSQQPKQFRGGEKKVMKKSLSLLVAIAMVFSMFAAVASAAEETKLTTEQKYEELVKAGLFEGYPDGEAHLDKEMTRAQASKIVALLTGYSEGVEVKDAGYTDLVGAGWATDYINYATQVGILEGKGNNKFDPSAQVTVQQLATIAVKLAKHADVTVPAGEEVEGKVDAWAADAVASAIAAGLLAKQDDYTVNANRGVLVEVVYSAKEILAQAGALQISSAKATGAKVITVKFNKAVKEELTFDLKRDKVNVNIAKVEWNEAKDEAKLTASFNFSTGKHKVTVKGEDVELTAETDVTEAKVSKIEFPSQNGIIVESPAVATGNKQGLRVNVKFYNQYGEDVTSTINLGDLSITSSKGTVNSFNKGALVLSDGSSLASAYDYVVDQKVVVTIVHKPSTAVGTATLSVVQAAAVASIEIGDLTTKNEDLQGKVINVDRLNDNASDYYIPVIAKDQYGNVLTAADLGSLTILSSSVKVLDTDTAVADRNDQTVININANTIDATHGITVVTIVAPNGTNANKSFEVVANAKVDTMNFSQPDAQLKKSVKTQIPFTAADQFGNALVNSSELALDNINAPANDKLTLKDGTTVSVTGATIQYDVDYVNKNAVKISVTPNADTVVLTTITANHKVQSLTLSAAAAPVATAIKGLKDDVYTLLQQGQGITLGSGNLALIDQYANSISLPANWEVEVEYVNSSATTHAVTIPAGTNVIDSASTPATVAFSTSTAAKGTEQFKLTLFNDTGAKVDEYVLSLEAVELKAITTFQLADIGTVYTGGDLTTANNDFTSGSFNLADYNRAITLEGLKGNKKVKVDQGLVVTAGISNGLSVNSSYSAIEAPAAKVNTDGAEKEATLTVVVDTANGAQNLVKTVKYNSAKPAASTIVVRKGSSDYTSPVFVTTNGTALNAKSIGPKAATAEVNFRVRDQYGIDFNLDQKYAITGKDSALGASLAIDATGTISGLVEASNSGKSFEVTIVTSNGLTKTLKIIIG